MAVIEKIKAEDKSTEQSVEAAAPAYKVPAPTAVGNRQIDVLKHGIVDAFLDDRGNLIPACLEVAIRNVSETKVATAIFEAVWYDRGGAVLGSVRHKEHDLPPETSRAIRISTQVTRAGEIQSYAVKLVRMTTVEAERFQLIRHESSTSAGGEEDVMAIVKNISATKADAALVASFLDVNNENIGTRVLVLRDIGPGTVRKCNLKFMPTAGDVVAAFALVIGELAE